MFRRRPGRYLAMNDSDKHRAREMAVDQFEDRLPGDLQRRHNYSQLRSAAESPQPLDKGRMVLKVIQDIDYLVHRCDEHPRRVRRFLAGVGCKRDHDQRSGRYSKRTPYGDMLAAVRDARYVSTSRMIEVGDRPGIGGLSAEIISTGTVVPPVSARRK